MLSTETIPSGATLIDDQPLATGPIVVATDGSAASEPALIAALRLTEHSDTMVHVVAIHEFRPVPVVEFAAMPALLEAEDGRREALRRQVESQVHRIAGDRNRAWSIIVRDGEPARELADIASEFGARALVIGVKHRQLTDRLFGRETALRLLHLVRVPLFIVPSGFAHTPRRALIATDFSAASLNSARTALQLFDSISHVTLLHVTPSPASEPFLQTSWREWLDDDATRGFEWAKAELGLPPTIRLETLSREGHPAREVVSVARDKGVDLIVTGTRGAGLLDRFLVGSTARSVVHGADCAVLVVRPPAHLNVPYPVLEPARQLIPPENWGNALASFTRRNAGRRVTLEVDDIDCGAQVQVTNYTLLGVDYDQHSQQVEIMVGDFTGTQRHLTRNISNVRSIEILPDVRAYDWILRIAHGKGHTLLILQR